MKAITQPVHVRKATNCTGPDEWFQEQDFEVEQSDVGHDRDNYLGFHHATYRFKQSDVGRCIRQTRQHTGYSCWGFLLPTAG